MHVKNSSIVARPYQSGVGVPRMQFKMLVALVVSFDILPNICLSSHADDTAERAMAAIAGETVVSSISVASEKGYSTTSQISSVLHNCSPDT